MKTLSQFLIILYCFNLINAQEKSKITDVVVYLDGAEIRESVLTLLYLDQLGANVSIFAPDVDQRDVVDHKLGESELMVTR